MKKTPVVGTVSADYSQAKLDEQAFIKGMLDSWEEVPYAHASPPVVAPDPSKYPTIKPAVLKPASPRWPQALPAITARVTVRLPMNGSHYGFLAPEVVYDIATDTVKVHVVMVDHRKQSVLTNGVALDMFVLERAKPGDWTVVDVAVEQIVAELIREAVLKLKKEQDTHDVPNQTKWSYTKKPRRSFLVREGTPSSPEVHPV